MQSSKSEGVVTMLGGRLAVDFANAPSFPGTTSQQLSWEQLISVLEGSRIVSQERGAALLSLPESDARAAAVLLARATRLRDALRQLFGALIRNTSVAPELAQPINEILRITEGHDELVHSEGRWKLAFVARESGLDWLLAAIARSAAEILTEGAAARLSACANPACGLLFCDTSRTHRRRWCSMAVCGNRYKVASFARRAPRTFAAKAGSSQAGPG
jgi:predicted RNA-binding Zn ribbon-like protein